MQCLVVSHALYCIHDLGGTAVDIDLGVGSIAFFHSAWHFVDKEEFRISIAGLGSLLSCPGKEVQAFLTIKMIFVIDQNGPQVLEFMYYNFSLSCWACARYLAVIPRWQIS